MLEFKGTVGSISVIKMCFILFLLSALLSVPFSSQLQIKLCLQFIEDSIVRSLRNIWVILGYGQKLMDAEESLEDLSFLSLKSIKSESFLLMFVNMELVVGA